MLGIVAGILLFMFLVMIHELGHYFTAKKAGVKVLEFGIGIPPKAFTLYTDKSGTEWTLNWIPLGGFVRLKGEDPDQDDFLDKDSFITASVPWKLIILFGGVAVNTLFAWLIFSFAFLQGVKPIMVAPEAISTTQSESYLIPTASFLQEQGFVEGDFSEQPAKVVGVLSDSLAAGANISSGAVLISVDGLELTNQNLGTTLKGYIGKTFDLIYREGDQEITTSITCPNDQCLLGVQIDPGEGYDILPIKFSGITAFQKGRQEVVEQTKLTFGSLASLFKNGGISRLSGPVCIVKFGDNIIEKEITSQTSQVDKNSGIALFLAFGGMISLALAIFNVLPIPALDGGRALGVLIQSVFRMKPEKYFVIENYFNIIFFVLIMGLGIYIILIDLQRCRGVDVPFL